MQKKASADKPFREPTNVLHPACSTPLAGRTMMTKDMTPHSTVKRMCRPSLLKLPPVSNRMKVATKRLPTVYSSAQCTGGSSRQAVAWRSLCRTRALTAQ